YQIQNGRLTFGFALLVVSLFTVYKLDKVLKIDDLPFETTLKYAFWHYWRYWFQKKQLYKDQRLNSNNKKYQLI
ncbi:MFS transporter permease, partial [Leuconostoc suionicum]|nr:MFS transporter permease [Leuconostoc suionicum]